MAANPQAQNEDTYESLISLIENSQGRLAPIIVACDDWALRQRVIDRYESEAREAKVVPYRVVLGREPSVRAALAKLKAENEYLQRGGEAVFTVTGAETLLRVKLKPEDEQSELDKFFGYLQWTREGLREFRYPIVLWVTFRILKEISRRAPDFWSWRKAVLRFETETKPSIEEHPPIEQEEIELQSDDFLPTQEELQAEIQQLESTSPNSPSLATLYEKLGQVYVSKAKGERAANLEQAIDAFETAIQYYQRFKKKSAQATALTKLGDLLYSQSRFTDAIDLYEQSLVIARKLGDSEREFVSLNKLADVYDSLGQSQRAFITRQQSFDELIEQLLTPNNPLAYSLLASIEAWLRQFNISSRVEAVDILHEAYLRAKAKKEQGEIIRHPLAWLKQVCYNIVREQSRKINRETIQEPAGKEPIAPEVLDLYKNTVDDGQVSEKVLKDRIDTMLKAFAILERQDPESAELLKLREVEGLSWLAVQAHLVERGRQIPSIESLRQRSTRARKMLRQIFYETEKTVG